MKALFDFVLVTGDWAADGAPEPDAIAHRETSHIGKGRIRGRMVAMTGFEPVTPAL